MNQHDHTAYPEHTAPPGHPSRTLRPAYDVKAMPTGVGNVVTELESSTDPDQTAEVGKVANLWRFFVYSGIGIFAFFIPFTVGEKRTILLDHIVTWITTTLGEGTRYLALIAIIAGTVYQFVSGRWREDYARMVFAGLSVLAVILCAMLTFGFGPAFLFNPEIGPFILDKLVISVGLLIPVGAIFLGLLVGFGLMEFIGVLVQPIMRPVFHTPGKSAVDAVASFLGSYSLGLLITDRMYKSGNYNGQEAAIIASGFSTVSATFMVIVAKTPVSYTHLTLPTKA